MNLMDILYLIIVILILLIIYFGNKSNIQKLYDRNIASWTKILINNKNLLQKIKDHDCYLMKDDYKHLRKSFIRFPSYFRKYKKQFLNWKYKDFLEVINKIYSDNFLVRYNNKFIDNELSKEKVKNLFDDIDGKSLDRSQREIIVSEEKNTLVIAGAGSGKTLTISGKVSYLTKELGIKPDEILLLTFTNKASDEMKERIKIKLDIDVNVYTFHKLGIDIISKHQNSKPTIVKETLLSEITSEFLEDKIFNNHKLSGLLLEFFSYYFYTPVEENDYENLTEYNEELKANKLETLKDQIDGYEKTKELLDHEKITIKREKVKSFEELSIANFLYLNNINYIYEYEYPKKVSSEKYMQYRPDFYLPDYDIYIEHYGITRDHRVPWLSEIKEEEYLKSIDWKREIHKKDENKYIESFSYYNSEGILLEKLKQKLENLGVKFLPKNKKEVLKFIVEKDQHFYNEFKKLIMTFLNQYKSNGLDFFENSIEKLSITYREKIFLNIVYEIYKEYESYLFEENQIDFNDMINSATRLVMQNKIKLEYKYIIIDEYQDISSTRYKLIDSIRNQTNSKLFVVGDDWQSIYRFAGSDVNLINDFEEMNHSETLTKMLHRTYRNSQNLIDIIGSFIMKNTSQREKNLLSDKSISHPIRLRLYEDNKLKSIIQTVEEIKKEFLTVNQILLLGRYKFDNLINENGKIINILKELKARFKEINFEFMTIHKSKGLEGEHVIIVNTENSKLGFPSKIGDDKLLNLVLPKKEKLKYAEERRLFYVAITRTKNTVYLISPNNNPGLFVRELVNDGFLPNVFEEGKINCPKCNGLMELKDKDFWGCSNYPFCDHTVTVKADLDKVCPSCGDYLVRRKGPYGQFYGCNSFKYSNDPVKNSCKYKIDQKNY